MHIREISFDGFDGSEPEGLKRGSVSLVAENGRIEVALVAPPRVSPWKRALERRLLRRAVATVLRLPEYRDGREELWFDGETVARMRLGVRPD
ncbi:hypothetical protein KUV62_09475 [Salipiger bermudensis]|uniref:hypothetical protein n=1 Tax=Salipiger bermudensis TaxID=344736 RepID=UPI001C993287|nr:hypothetical protein [Salipiger bermudensis]MBY6004137.1 hypothetical protein [Salipiger bermudensis]